MNLTCILNDSFKIKSFLTSSSIKEILMQLGAFSISLTVKDIEKSKVFYEKLGFSVFHGNQDQKWLIMKNGDHIIFCTGDYCSTY